jgi:hypothetical protein
VAGIAHEHVIATGEEKTSELFVSGRNSSNPRLFGTRMAPKNILCAIALINRSVSDSSSLVRQEIRSYEEEFIAFLKRHNIQYDPRYIWG